MSHLKITALIVSLTLGGCYAGPKPTPTDPSNALAPAPVVAHVPTADAVPAAAAEIGNAKISDPPSVPAHHADPVAKPESDPLSPGSVDPVGVPLREITLPAGTVLNLQLGTTVSSTASRVEDDVQATVRRAVMVDGVTVVPAGAAVSGFVSEAQRSAKVKGRARVAVRFNALRVGGMRYEIRTSAVSRLARATKKADATKIGVGAGAGAVIGAITGGKKGAVIGTAVGAAGGTGVVLATRGEEVSLGRGTVVTTRLAAPLTIRVR